MLLEVERKCPFFEHLNLVLKLHAVIWTAIAKAVVMLAFLSIFTVSHYHILVYCLVF